MDMNLYCSTDTNKCSCREDMRWNKDELECQVYMDVDCSGYEQSGYRNKRDVNDINNATIEDPIDDREYDDPSTVSTNDTEILTPGDLGVQLAEYNLTEEFNITELTPEKTLEGSELVKLNVTAASKDDIQRTFCREIKAVSVQYEQPYRQKNTSISSLPPVIADNSTRSIVAQENFKAELRCHASGSPKPVVSWRRENNQILPTGGIVYRGNVLTVHTLKKQDRGTYYCVADNGIGKAAQRAVAVDVEFPPVVTTSAPSVSGGESRIGQALGYSVELVCHIEAFPRPTITWISPKKNQLTTNLNYVVDNGYQTADDHTETSIRIKRLGRQYLGKYICRAQNKLGTTEQVIEVVETYTPNCEVGLCEQPATSASIKSSYLMPLMYFIKVFIEIFY